MLHTSGSSACGIRIVCSACSLRDFCLPEGLDFKEVERIEELITTRRRIRRGEALYRAGDPFEAFYAVRLGFLKGSVLASDGREQVTMFYMSGDIVGFDGLANGVYSSDMIALEDTEICVVSYKKLRDAAVNAPAIAQHFERLLSREIIRQNGVLCFLDRCTPNKELRRFTQSLAAL